MSAGVKVGTRRLDLAKRAEDAMGFAYGGNGISPGYMLEGVCAARRQPPRRAAAFELVLCLPFPAVSEAHRLVGPLGEVEPPRAHLHPRRHGSLDEAPEAAYETE